jgi:hypothetical protein
MIMSATSEDQRTFQAGEKVQPDHMRFFVGSFSDEELIAALLQVALQKDVRGRLPLHWAVLYNSSQKVVAKLLSAHPEGACEKDKDGNLPLHLLLFEMDKKNSNFNLETFTKLLTVYPEGCFSTQETLNACLLYFVLIDDLPKIVLKSCVHPLRALLVISAALKQFSNRKRLKLALFTDSSIDLRLGDSAEEKANDIEQLACAIVRKCKCGTIEFQLQEFRREIDDCLQLAAELKLKFFISETECSKRLDQLWSYGHGKERPLATLLVMAVFVSIQRLTLPLIFKFTHDYWIPNPFVRFLQNRVHFFIFLILLLQQPRQVAPGDPIENIYLEISLLYWLLDICFQEATEIFDCGFVKYFEDYWNMYDLVSLSVAGVAAVARAAVYAGVGTITADTSNQLYAWGLALLWGRLVNILLVIPFTGPLLIMIFVMIFKDLTKFVFLVVLMELPFIAALYYLENGETDNNAFATFSAIALSFLKIAIGQGPEISSLSASSSVLLYVGTALLVVLMLNLLIAMFSKTFDAIVENSTQEYLLQKAQMVFHWAHHAQRTPPPFTLYLVVRDWVMNLIFKHLCYNKTFALWCVGKGSFKDGASNVKNEPGLWMDPKDIPSPVFNRLHFFKILFPHW